jgi:membrane-bound lytic murein transglycosylase D
MKNKWNWIHVVFTAAFGSAFGICGALALSADIPDLISSVRFSKPLAFCGEPVPLESREVRERLERELLLSLWDRPQVILWVKRSGRYFPGIEKMLKESGLPEDLKYVAVAESALKPHAGSSKGAVGFWQFMPQTGRKYGLTIDSRIDERRSPTASTGAAIAYFKDLHAFFGSWTTATAAFNAGEGKVAAEIMEQGTGDYYQLYLPLETQRFLFRILAIKIILSEPERYGFALSEEDYYRPPASEPIRLACPKETPVRILAQAADTRFKVIKDLNPEILGHYLPVGDRTILVPEGTASGYEERYARLLGKYLKAREERVHIVQPGDNLSRIAERYGIPLTSLLIWNRIDVRKPIHPGDRLVVFSNTLPSNDSDVETDEGDD